MLKSDELEILKNELIKNLENSHSPYSNYSVSVLLFTEHNVFKGVNIEDGVQSICAERSAFASAISAGDKNFKKIFIIAKDNNKNEYEYEYEYDDNVYPCGHCLQFLSEFVDESFPIYIFGNKEIKIYTLNELFPYRFKR